MEDMNTADIVVMARELCERFRDDLLNASRDIHSAPEIRFEEYKASGLLCELLRKHGFEVEEGLATMPTAFRGIKRFGVGGPTVVVFSEYDALPGIGHACGHNVIATAGLGAGLIAAALLEHDQDSNGTLIVLGSPGEEGGGGKVKLIDAGELAQVDAAVMIHPAGYDAVSRENLGRIALEISFEGKASHAASAPDQGLNALDAATLFLVAIGLLRQQVRSSSRLHAIVLDGGEAVNVIPESSRLRVFVRSPDNTYLYERLLPAVEACAKGAAIATGTVATLEEVAPAYASLRTNSVVAEVAREAFTALGRAPKDEASENSSAGSTDMGNVSRVVPSIHPYINIGTGIAGHTREFERAAGGPEGESAVLDGATILATTVVVLMKDADLLERAKAEFAAMAD